jgi:hypothetical protein
MRDRSGRSGTLGWTTPNALGDRLLAYAAALYAVGLAVHTADHIRRGTDVLTGEVLALGTASTLGGLAVIALVFARHRLAPLAAVVFGFPVALGVAATHLLPEWSDFSDAFPGAHHTGVTAFSWAVALLEIAGLLALGAAGVYAMRHDPDRKLIAR